ncbi:ribosome maturation factor RimP [Zafaria sp. J156]|nr:ribosome maturation factor RimP [Zafaria sp. J156]MEE1621936.1 ribosome maturation factor RimP [Zafaria sp. J156]
MSGQPDARPEADRLKEYLEPAVASHRLHLEDVEVRTTGSHRTVHVVVDHLEGTDPVDLDTIAEVSRSLSEAMDRDPHDDGTAYDLEVSSFGVGRPLTQPRHWRRNVGRLVKVNVREGENLAGRLTEAGGDSITVVPDLPVKKGMKPKQGDPVTVPYAAIRRGTVDVDFTRSQDPAVDVLDTTDEEEEA